MPVLRAEYLLEVCQRILGAEGVPSDEAGIVGQHLVEASLHGHDSHGVARLRSYVQRVLDGVIVPGAPTEVLDETETTFRVDGHRNFGFVVAHRAMERVIEKARRHSLAAAVVFNEDHTGRLALFTLMAANQGLIGLMANSTTAGTKYLAPFGGRAPRLSTSPFSAAFPTDPEEPMFLDMASTAIAGGKLALASERGEALPPGVMMDVQGNPTTDPAAYEMGGALLPLGGEAFGYKGFGLAMMVQGLATLLSGSPFRHQADMPPGNCSFMMAIRVEAFRPLADYVASSREFIAYLKATPLAPGHREVLYPGERSHRTARERRALGIPVDERFAEWMVRALAELPG